MGALSAEFLLIDIGNTHAKFRLASRERLLGRTRRVLTADLESDLMRTLQDWRYDRIILAAVVPDAARVVTSRLDRPILQVNFRSDTGVDLRAYPGKRTLGADRLADLAGAWALHRPGPLIVADLGTAAVFNALDARGVFRGGMIAPGLSALPARGAQLPPIRLTGQPRALGRTTPEALRAGAIYGFRGLVREILAILRAELGANTHVIATGGDARRLAAALPEIDVVDPNLTFQGMRVIAGRPWVG